jgi:hypothetical protein
MEIEGAKFGITTIDRKTWEHDASSFASRVKSQSEEETVEEVLGCFACALERGREICL